MENNLSVRHRQLSIVGRGNPQSMALACVEEGQANAKAIGENTKGRKGHNAGCHLVVCTAVGVRLGLRQTPQLGPRGSTVGSYFDTTHMGPLTIHAYTQSPPPTGPDQHHTWGLCACMHTSDCLGCS